MAELDYPDQVPASALFVEADEPMLIFPSIGAAEKYLEAADVRAGTYPSAFGPRGEEYRVVAEDDRVLVKRVDGSARPEALRQLVLRYLDATGRQVDPSASTEAIVQAVWREEAAFWREHDPFGERFGTRVSGRTALLVIVAITLLVFVLMRLT